MSERNNPYVDEKDGSGFVRNEHGQTVSPHITITVTGVHRHYKGGKYTLLFVAETHNHNGDLDVVYISHTTGSIVTRPFQRDSRNEDSWTDIVEWPDGGMRRRFALETDDTKHMFPGPW